MGAIDTNYIVILYQNLDLAAYSAEAANALYNFALGRSASVSADLAEDGPCGTCLLTGSTGYAG